MELFDKNESVYYQEMAEIKRAAFKEQFNVDGTYLSSWVYHLWQMWANFGMAIVSPTINMGSNQIFLPEEDEEVYPIHYHEGQWIASRGQDAFLIDSMQKMYQTIEKTMVLLIDHLNEHAVDKSEEVDIVFFGHELCKRKAYEVVINMPNDINLVVKNYNPEEWAEFLLNFYRKLSDLGFELPSQSPRPQSYKNRKGRDWVSRRQI